MCVQYCLKCCKHAGSDFKRNNRIWFLCLYLCIRHLKTARDLLNKILPPRQEVQSILNCTEKWLKRHGMRTLRKNSPGQVEWNGGSSTILILWEWVQYYYLLYPSESAQRPESHFITINGILIIIQRNFVGILVDPSTEICFAFLQNEEINLHCTPSTLFMLHTLRMYNISL